MNKLIALIFFILIAPIFLVVASACLALQGRPILFVSERAGKNGHPFMLFKFRTMDAATTDDEKDVMRITKIGNILRSTSLDEIPQILNIIRGNMNFFGPRPLLCDYNNFYSNAEKIRLKVKPGITGLAQVMGRNTISWRRKFVLDAYYVRNRSFRLNLFIFYLTLKTVLLSRDINVSGDTTMTRFSGGTHEK